MKIQNTIFTPATFAILIDHFRNSLPYIIFQYFIYFSEVNSLFQFLLYLVDSEKETGFGLLKSVIVETIAQIEEVVGLDLSVGNLDTLEVSEVPICLVDDATFARRHIPRALSEQERHVCIVHFLVI